MSLALLGIAAPGATISDRSAVTKSYPGFFADIDRIVGEP